MFCSGGRPHLDQRFHAELTFGQSTQGICFVAASDEDPIGGPVGVSTNLLFLGSRNRWRLVTQEMKPGKARLEWNACGHAANRGAQFLVSAGRRRQADREGVSCGVDAAALQHAALAS